MTEKLTSEQAEQALLDDLCGIDALNKQEVEQFGERHGCKVVLHIEKINSLQYTYFYELDFGKIEKLFVEIENGINNGTVLKNAEWGVSTRTNTKTIQVCTDVVFDEETFRRMYMGDESNVEAAIARAKHVFNTKKPMLMEMHRKMEYDNHVTGGGTIVTIQHYRNEVDKLKKRGLHFNYVYEIKEVDRSFIDLYKTVCTK